jgi:hypothetical protein
LLISKHHWLSATLREQLLTSLKVTVNLIAATMTKRVENLGTFSLDFMFLVGYYLP